MPNDPQHPARRHNPAAVVSYQIEARGLEFFTRLAACITTHRQPLSAIADNWKIELYTLEQIRRATFDLVTLGGERVYVLKPEARRQLDLAENFRRRMYDECREAEQQVRYDTAHVKPHDPIDDLGLTDGNRDALKQIRRKLGAVKWVQFIAMLYDLNTPPIIMADCFQEVIHGPHDAAAWRKVVTNTRHVMNVEQQINVPPTGRKSA